MLPRFENYCCQGRSLPALVLYHFPHVSVVFNNSSSVCKCLLYQTILLRRTSVLFDARLTSYSCAAGGHCEQAGATGAWSPSHLRTDRLSIDQQSTTFQLELWNVDITQHRLNTRPTLVYRPVHRLSFTFRFVETKQSGFWTKDSPLVPSKPPPRADYTYGLVIAQWGTCFERNIR